MLHAASEQERASRKPIMSKVRTIIPNGPIAQIGKSVREMIHAKRQEFKFTLVVQSELIMCYDLSLSHLGLMHSIFTMMGAKRQEVDHCLVWSFTCSTRQIRTNQRVGSEGNCGDE